MKKWKRILAVAAAALLLGLYGATLVFAMLDSPFAYGMFQACLYCTIAVPVLLYAMLLVYRRLKERSRETAGSRIDTVILDVGNVLVDYNWKRYLDSLDFSEEAKRAVAAAVYENPLWEEQDRGEKSDEALTEAFVQNAPAYEREIRIVTAEPGGTIFALPYAEEWIAALKKRGLRVYILSNYGEKMFRQTKARMTFLPLADGALFSFQCHMIKPERGIYEKLLRDFKIDPGRAVFIDDRQANLDGARRAGIRGLRFTDYPDTKKALERVLDTEGL